VRTAPALLAAVLGAGSAAAIALAGPAGAMPAATTTPVAGGYAPVTPFRAVDTRTGARGNHRGALLHGKTFTATIGGLGNVPKRVAAVALTITAVAPTANGGLIVYQAGAARPVPQNLRFGAGRTTSAAAIVRTSAAGRVAVFNAARTGSTQVAIDVSGYYVAGRPSAETPGVLHTVTPRHALGARTIGSHRTLTANLGGRDGVPTSSVGAVAVLVTATSPAKAGALVAYEAGGHRPRAATTTFARGISSTGFGLVPTDGDGRISIYNTSPAKVRLTLDVVGYTVGGIVMTAGATQVGSAVRIVTAAQLLPNHAKTVTVTGRAGVPDGHITAVLVDLQAASGSPGSLVAWRADGGRPTITNVRLNPGEPAAGLALVRASPTGKIKIRNSSPGTVTLSVDVVGYVAAKNAPPVAPPVPSASHYIRTVINGGSEDAQGMESLGCDDANYHSTLVLLEFGAQSVTPPLSTATPGVLLTTTQTRLTYAQLESALLGDSHTNGYLTGFSLCASGLHATIALGTNNDGSFSGENAYPAGQRGTDWANFVAAVRAAAPPGLTVVGANDIESTDFSGTKAQAVQWEQAYLAVDNAAGAVGNLIYNGSADGCPSSLGVTHRTCANGWTQADYYQLTHGLSASRIRALPQVYNSAQPVQWANIDATGGGAIQFAGSLTEHGDCPTGTAPGCNGLTSATPTQGWRALYKALATVVAHPRIPAATDLLPEQ
jgi:hypothetical protein